MKIRAGVFFGGPSVEHEVSVISGMQAIAAMDKEKYEVIPVYVAKDGAFYTGEQLGDIEAYRDVPAALAKATEMLLTREGGDAVLLPRRKKLLGGEKPVVLDVAVPVFHGTGGEDGVMQAHFERVGLPYAGCGVCASAVGMDKYAMKALFMMEHVPCLPAMKLRRAEYFEDSGRCLDSLEKAFGYPLIVKPYDQGSSVGIGKARNRTALQSAMEEALQYSEAAICERAVQNLREINCAVLGDEEAARASVCEEPLNATDILTYADKYQRGGGGAKNGGKSTGGGMQSLARRVPADLPPEMAIRVQELAVAAFRAVGAAGVSRVDFLMDGVTGELWVNEINTIPGSLAFYLWEASGLPFSGLMDELVNLALKRRRRRAELKRSFDVNLLATAQLKGSKGKV
ncbi:MAG: D-alanine--D-alanine ligase family protein [Clostridiaceae bacterium]|nr:D-alanine--D-alanine ligase family protein [Clostridiaceae bacterium]